LTLIICLHVYILIFYICSVFILSQNITFKIGLYVTCLLIFLFSQNHFLTAWQRGGSVGHASAGAAAQPTEASVRGFPYFVYTRRLEGSPRVDFGLPTDVWMGWEDYRISCKAFAGNFNGNELAVDFYLRRLSLPSPPWVWEWISDSQCVWICW